jgi:transketolase
MATRAASGKVINALAPVLQNLVGGSADLAPSNKTMIAGSGDMRGKGSECGRNIHFGVREHAMGAVINGMALHGGVVPYAGTFFVFSDFMRPSLRLAALMQTNSTFIFTHDSLGVGEDGPTHQPVEHLMSLRLMPGLSVVRPADANETAAAWKLAMEKDGPVALCLTRQKLPVLEARTEDVQKGAYVLKDSQGAPDIVLMASGSEVHLALEAAQELEGKGKACRVVSMPCWEVFSQQSQEYQDEVMLPQVKAKVAIEAGVTLGWERYVGQEGRIIGVDRFGASAPGSVVFKELGLNLENVVDEALSLFG